MSRYYDQPSARTGGPAGYASNQSDSYGQQEYPRANLYPPTHHFNDGSSESLQHGGYEEPSMEKYDTPMAYGSNDLQRGPGNPYAQPKRSNKKRWIIAGVVLLVLAAAGGGIAAWRILASKNAAASTSSAGTSTSSSSTATPSGTTSTGASSSSLAFIPGTANVVKSNPKDPSQFELDPRLHKSFYGFAYTPLNVQEPQCGAVQANITEDIQLMSQLTTRLRMYGSACNQSAMVLQAIKDTKVNMTVWLGVYIGDDETVNTQQMQVTLNVISTYGTTHISGVTVGNEYILNALNPTVAVTYLTAQMATFRAALKKLNMPTMLPVGTSDAGSVITSKLAAGADFIMANVHPFFGGLAIKDAAAWTNSYFQETDVAVTGGKPTYVAETGWPTNALTTVAKTFEGAVAGVSQLQTYLDTFPCAANANRTGYFYFEMFDEGWKRQFLNSTEPYWGLFDGNKVLKNVTLPTCISP